MAALGDQQAQETQRSHTEATVAINLILAVLTTVTYSVHLKKALAFFSQGGVGDYIKPL